jgi:chromosomal replication initiator protein
MSDRVRKNWKKIIKKLRVDNQITEVSYKTWIKPLEVIKVKGNVVYISVPLEAQRELVTKKYLQPLKVCIAEVTGQEYDINLIIDEDNKKIRQH